MIPRNCRFWLVFCSALAYLIPLAVAAQQYPESLYQEMRWRMIGPFRGGRTRAATGVPSQPNVFYIGVVNGGVWKTEDYGRTWSPIFDAQPTQSIGDIVVAPSDPNTLYVGSGEGLHRPDLSVGDGIYKSIDGGKTWTQLGLRDAQQIPALAIDPHDPNRVFAAVLGHPYGPNTERGIFRSTDGGQTWQKVLYKDENTGGADVEIDPSNPRIVYASLWEARLGPWEDGNEYSGIGGGLFKSTDGGTTWRPLKNGLPADLVQIHVAIASSQPNRLYTVFSTTTSSTYGSGKGLGFYRSDDGGENWYNATSDPRPAMKIGGGDLPMIKVDPTNPDVVYSTSIVTVRSTDGGKTWTSIRGAPGGDDYQNIWINPNNPNIILLVADQGAIVSVNGGQTWSSWYNQPTAQLYHVTTSNTFPYRVCGGQQESGSVCILSRGNDGEITFRDWHPVGVIEYGYAAPDPLDPEIVYGAGRNEVSRFHWSTGQVENVTPIPIRGETYRTERTEPIMFSPVDPHILYYAANVLFISRDGGRTWETISSDLSRQHPGVPSSLGKMAAKDPKADKQRGAIYALAPSFRDVNILWAGTDDGLVWRTRDGGKNWKDITPPELTPWSKVTQIAASRFDDDTAYVSVSRLRIDDLRPYLYRTHDAGKTWQRIVSGLPENAPVNAVREDPVRKGLLFAATETGVWVSFDEGDHWQSLQLNLPRSSARDLWIHDDDLIVATHGRSFWILDDITPLRQLSSQLMHEYAYLFQPQTAYLVRRNTNTDTPLPTDEPAGQNPPAGAILDYFLAAADDAVLEIVDSQGKSVRRYSSKDTPEITEEELDKQLIPLYWIRMPQSLPIMPGMHRWVWDLHYPAPLSARHEYPIAATPHDTPRVPLGPLALPGQYTVRLTVRGRSYAQPLTLKMDPRVKTPMADLEQQFKLQMRLASMLSDSSRALLEARSATRQLEKLPKDVGGTQGESIRAFEKKLTAVVEGPKDSGANSPAEPNLEQVNSDIYALYGSVGQADVGPTIAQVDAVEVAQRSLFAVEKSWNDLKGADLQELNRQLRQANLPEIRPEQDLKAGEGGGNE
ncbi:MAG TPA: glycoside hydrolase [Terriglobales bacterium]|nr:glycoside hydrolase [Terriglobales bacterium]